MTQNFLLFSAAPVIDPISNLTGNAGETVSVSCNALFGFPDLNYDWLKDGNILTSDGHHLRFPRPSELEIQLQGNDDQGKFAYISR